MSTSTPALQQLLYVLYGAGLSVRRPGQDNGQVEVSPSTDSPSGDLVLRIVPHDAEARVRQVLDQAGYAVSTRGEALVVNPSLRLLLQFTLPVRLPTFNPMLRTHWSRRRKQLRVLAWQVVEAIPYQQRPAIPFDNIVVEVDRYNTQEPDHENLVASAKLLLDVMQPLEAKARPYGLGIIRNDARTCVHDLRVRHVASRSCRTEVRIYAAAATATGK